MSHECPDCDQVCYCDGEDTFIETESDGCNHQCETEPCIYCEGVGCGSCEGEDCLHLSVQEEAGGFIVCSDCGKDVTREDFQRANRAAAENAIVAPLFDYKR